MLLQGKRILIFAAAGDIASSAARKFAQEGAHVYLSGRNTAKLEVLAGDIRASGGTAYTDMVDATDARAVEAYVQRTADAAGGIDGVFNGIGARPIDLHYPEASTTQSLEHFMLPLQHIVGSQFLTSRTAAAQMMRQGTGGAVVVLSATLSGMTAGYMAGISAACGAVEAMARALAGEFGPAGIRVNTVRGSAMPETRTIQETFAAQVQLMGDAAPNLPLPPLGRPITVAETVATAAFLLSDQSSGMTGQVVTVCAGAFV